MRSGWILNILVLVGSNILSAQTQPVPTTIEDFFLPGSQPGESAAIPPEHFYPWNGDPLY